MNNITQRWELVLMGVMAQKGDEGSVPTPRKLGIILGREDTPLITFGIGISTKAISMPK